MKRIVLFVATNIAVIAVIGVILSLLGVDDWLTESGINWTALLILCSVIGFAGSFISLAISKWMAIRAYSIQVIKQPSTEAEQWLYNKISELSQAAGIGMPDIGVYESSEVNAFATGARRNKALVAVSSGLLYNMDNRQVAGVLAHEVAHVANGDMVTMCLLQGVLNTFVGFFSRVIGYVVDQALRRDDDEGGLGIGYFITYYVSSIILSIVAMMIVMAYSRRREFRADAMGAELTGKASMISALQRLNQIMHADGPIDDRAASVSALKISNKSQRNFLLNLFASHPPLEKRIAALERLPIAG